MSIRKRAWKTSDGTVRTAWVLDYFDQHRKRRLRTFDRKQDAERFQANTRVEIGKGIHIAERESITIKQAGDLWLAECRAENLEPTTVEQYSQHLRLHIEPFMGATKLSQIGVPRVSAFRTTLREQGRSAAMVKGVLGSLGSLISAAQERGQAAHNPVRELRRTRRGKHGKAVEKRHKPKLRVGVDIPLPEEMRALVAKAKGRWKPLLMTAVVTGLRASELRGLRWEDVHLDLEGESEIHVNQRADKFRRIGSPKSASSYRTIPLAKNAAKALAEWKLICPRKREHSKDVGKLWLVFPNGAGNVELLGNIIKRGLIPTMIAAGLTVPLLNEHKRQRRDKAGKPIVKAKYTGMHALRHFFASWCINRIKDDGCELPPKVVQELLGHSTIAMTMDVYGHLFPRNDDRAELEAAAQSLFGAS
ncbi:integrase [Nitrobacter vulgaris]|uniref:tyrosine-type recombinase/integrase n=1 Tax=Nitrobacter vulgaris TaxID=29421 RepID=UPI002858C89B|nr:tyrosine-type recombinase/integrase [Nitrobacter vulgaris]MDR6304685.1 integrase [Nitrobacter vulgaris]